MQRDSDPSLTVATKLQPPRQQGALVRRTNLIETFGTAILKRLVLLSAPAGYGKTSLLTELYDDIRARFAVAWLTLDTRDNDVVRFAAHLVRAIEIGGGVVDPLLRDMLGPGRGPDPISSVSSLTERIINALSHLHADLFIFMDDLQLCASDEVLRLLGELLTAPIPGLHLIISTREQRPLPVARLKIQNQVYEATADDLAFSYGETKALIECHQGRLISVEEANAILRKTEGWPAGVRLALIAAEASADGADLTVQLSGSDKDLCDYLIDEVLRTLSTELQEFLLATSILDRFNGDLCDAILERTDSRGRIDKLSEMNLFIFSLDRARKWYRYHTLFADFLRRRLVVTHPLLAKQYHTRAGVWLETHGEALDAMEHALALSEFGWAAQLLDSVSNALFASGQSATLRDRATQIPLLAQQACPWLRLDLAWENTIQWHFAEARAGIDAAITDFLGNSQGGMSASDTLKLEATLSHRDIMLHTFQDHLDAVLKHGTAWLEKYGVQEKFMSASIHTAMMMSRRESFDCELVLAEQDSLRRRYIHGGAIYGTVFLDTVVGNTLLHKGDLAAAESALTIARVTAQRISGDTSILAAMPSACLAKIKYENGKLAEAESLIDQFTSLPLEFGLVDSIIAQRLTLARIHRTQDNLSEAHRVLDAATQVADEYKLTRMHAYVLAERLRLLLGDALFRDAEHVIRHPRYVSSLGSITPSGQVNTTKERFAVAWARLAAEQGSMAEAIQLIRRWHTWTKDRHCYYMCVQHSLLLAKWLSRQGEKLAARRYLLDALNLGSNGNLIRCFTDEGMEIANLIADLVSEKTPSPSYDQEYARRILFSFGMASSAPLFTAIPEMAASQLSALSEREIEIIRQSSRNLVSWEIGESLGLTESTVKWYWRQIFTKTGINRRGAIIRLARQQGLID